MVGLEFPPLWFWLMTGAAVILGPATWGTALTLFCAWLVRRHRARVDSMFRVGAWTIGAGHIFGLGAGATILRMDDQPADWPLFIYFGTIAVCTAVILIATAYHLLHNDARH